MTATLQDMRTEAQDLAQRINTMTTERAERTEARQKDDKAPEPWTEAHATEWKDINSRYDGLVAQIESREEEAQMAARAAEVTDFIGRRSADWNNRPTGDDLPPGQEGADDRDRRTYGDLGMTREQARRFEQRQHDLSLNFRSWATHENPFVSQLVSDDAFSEAREREKFNPSSPVLALAHVDSQSIGSLQQRLSVVHPERRQAIMDQFVHGREARSLAAGQGSAGGYLTVPAIVVRSIEVAMIRYGAVLAVADTITTATGENMGWPIADDTSNEGSYVDENQDHNTEVDPTFENVTWGAFELTSKFIKVPYRLQRDSFANLDQLIGQLIGERLGRKLSSEATLGTQRIRGFVPRCPVGHTTAGATAITYPDVVGLDHSLDPDHRPGMSYQFHDVVLEQLRLLVDSQNRPIWISNVANGAPDTFNGHRYTLNQKMSSTITSADKTMAAGDMSKIKVRRVGPMLRLKRLNERFAERDQTGFIGYMSADADVLRPNQDAACPIQILQQA